MRLGIVAAMADEARILSGETVDPQREILIRGDALLRLSGMGPEKARSASRRLIDQGVAALASWGIAGGLDPALTAGCLIIPRNVIAADSSIYHTDTAWRERLSGRIAARFPVNDGSLAECDSIIAERPEKLRIRARTGAAGIDMESAAIAREAVDAGIPFLAVRAVADTLETSVPLSALESVDEFGRVRLSRLMLRLVGRPGEIAGLLRMGKNYRAALKALQAAAALEGNVLCSVE